MYYIFKSIVIIFFVVLFSSNYASPSNENESFNQWLESYKKFALSKGVSKETISIAFKNVKYLSKVIGYDRKQPEFFEDTITYVSKRANKFRVTQAKKVYNQNKLLFNKVEGEFGVEKEILLSLWGIETNFGKHVGKMDIISSLATLSYDKRRRDYFSSELLILLKLIDRQLVDPIHGGVTCISRIPCKKLPFGFLRNKRVTARGGV